MNQCYNLNLLGTTYLTHMTDCNKKREITLHNSHHTGKTTKQNGKKYSRRTKKIRAKQELRR